MTVNCTGELDVAPHRRRLHMRDLLARRRPLFSGTLGRLRVRSRRRLVLSAGAGAALLVRVWLPSRARAYRARGAGVSLDLLSEAAD